jgi:hypothetical protein
VRTTIIVSSMILFAAIAVGGCRGTEPAAGDPHAHPHTTGSNDSLPPVVAAAFERQFPGAKITRVHKHGRASGPARWHLHYVTKEGQEEEALFQTDGTLVP